MTDLVVMFFIKARKNLMKQYGKNLEFDIVLYETLQGEIKYKELLVKKLKNNNFKVADTTQLTQEDLNSEKYIMKEDAHPNESAWNLLTPQIIKALDLH